jgi:alpha-mannosidase
LIQLPRLARGIEASFAPCEIKTFRLPRDENPPAIETNLLEFEERAKTER